MFNMRNRYQYLRENPRATSDVKSDNIPLKDGMILVATGPSSWSGEDQSSFPIGVVAIDPVSYQQSIVSSGGIFSVPTYIAQGKDGNLYVTDITAFGTGAVIKVEQSGKQTVIAKGGYVYGPNVLTFVNDKLYVSNLGDSSGAIHNIIEVDIVTGNQKLICDCSCAGFSVPVGIAPANNAVYVGDEPGNVQGIQLGSLWKVDLDTGIQTIVSCGNLFNHPSDIAVEADGHVLVMGTGSIGNGYAGNVVRVNPATGEQKLVTSFEMDAGTDSITVGTDGTIYVGTISVGAVPGRIYTVNPSTGAQGVLLEGGDISLVEGIRIYVANT